METISNFIGGKLVAPRNDAYLDVYEPATGEVYAKCPDSDASDIEDAVASALSAFPKWSASSVKYRSSILVRIADLVDRYADLLAAAESKDQGKPVWLARTVDLPRASANFRFFAGAVLQHRESSTKMDAQDPGYDFAINYTTRRPVGVAGLISPWNLPLYLLTWKIAPALATGNTVVCKPSELTPQTAFLFTRILIEAGLPAGVCNIVFGRGPTAGEALTKHPKVPVISFTGGTKTAESIIRNSAPEFKKLSLELGGKNPNIIFADADLDACVEKTVRSSFMNQGEICLCGSRILVEESIYPEFLKRFVTATKSLKVGDPSDAENFMGALVSKEHMQKVLGFIALAKKSGGEILAGGEQVDPGGRCANGYFIAPTIISGLPQNCAVVQEEIFGPVVTVSTFKNDKEAVDLANDVRYGLSASVWTRDLSRAHRISEALDVGLVWVNTWMLRDLRAPFGGVKASGVGREGGNHSIDFYTEVKNVCINVAHK